MALSVKRGETESRSRSVNRLADQMTEDQLVDFAGGVETGKSRKNRLTATEARRRARRRR